MIKFKHKHKLKTTQPVNQKVKIYESVIKLSDAQLTDILVNGVQLPGHKKLTEYKGIRRKKRYLSASYCEANPKQAQQQMSGLFRNTAIRSKLKSLQIQINVTAHDRQGNSLQRRFSFQRQTPKNLDQFIKTSNHLYQKARNEQNGIALTALNWTNKTFKVKNNIEQSVRCHSTKNKKQNPLWTSQHHFIGLNSKNKQKIAQFESRLSNSKGLYDCLLAKEKEYLSLRKSQGSRQTNLIQNLSVGDSSQIYKATFRQSSNQSKTKNKVCYSTKPRRQQNKVKIQTRLKSNKVVLSNFDQQETINDN